MSLIEDLDNYPRGEPSTRVLFLTHNHGFFEGEAPKLTAPCPLVRLQAVQDHRRLRTLQVMRIEALMPYLCAQPVRSFPPVAELNGSGYRRCKSSIPRRQ